MKKEIKDKIFQRIEEIVLILIIVLGILDFFEILPGDLDFLKKIVSWSLLGYLLYKASFTKIFFNNKNIHIDLLLIISYFLLIFKNIVTYANLNIEKFNFFYYLNEFVLENSIAFELYSFYIGIFMLILLSIFSAIKMDIRKPSLMHLIHEEGNPPKNVVKVLVRFLTIFFVFIAFFVVVFNLIMEWLIIAIDTPIIMIGILFYLFVVIRHYRKFDIESLIFRIGEFGENFYEKFISLFHYKKTIYLGISGILVLHLLTDIGNFILPYTIVFYDTIYFEQLGIGHTALIPLFLEQSKNFVIFEQLSLFFIYFLNLFAMVFLLSIPAFLWYLIFKEKEFHIKNKILSFFLMSFFVFILAPIFGMKKITSGDFIGVDILTNQANNYLFPSFFYLLIISFVLYLSILLLSKYFKRFFVFSSLMIGLLFFALYIYLFFTSLLNYYVNAIRILFLSSQYFLSFYFLLFLTITILFYVGGFLLFIYELIKVKIYNKIN